jgi:hypothetical protein
MNFNIFSGIQCDVRLHSLSMKNVNLRTNKVYTNK